MELGLRGGRGGDARLLRQREAEHADPVVDLRLRAAVPPPRDAGVGRVPEEDRRAPGRGVRRPPRI